MELGLDTTRSDGLEILRVLAMAARSTIANVRDWPKDQVLAKVSNTKEGRTWPKDQEVKMGARRRYS